MEHLSSSKDMKAGYVPLLTTEQILDQIDTYLTRLEKGYPVEPKAIFSLIDEANARLTEAEAQGITKTAERASFSYIEARIKKNARQLIRLIGGAEVLRAWREEHAPPPQAWWWFLDQWIAEQTARTLKRSLLVAAGVVLALLLVGVIYRLFLAPDEATQIAFTAQNDAQRAIAEGQFDQALQAVEKGLGSNPTNPELLLLKGVILQKMDRRAEALQIFEQSQKLIGSRESFLQARAILYLQIGDVDNTLADSEELIRLNPNSAEGYYYRAQVRQAKGDLQGAYADYEKANDLAQAQNKSELVAIIRVNMAYLLQSMGGQLIEATPTE